MHRNNSFICKTLEEFRNEYVAQYIDKITKGIIKDFRNIDFERNEPVRKLHNIRCM